MALAASMIPAEVLDVIGPAPESEPAPPLLLTSGRAGRKIEARFTRHFMVRKTHHIFALEAQIN